MKVSVIHFIGLGLTAWSFAVCCEPGRDELRVTHEWTGSNPIGFGLEPKPKSGLHLSSPNLQIFTQSLGVLFLVKKMDRPSNSLEVD